MLPRHRLALPVPVLVWTFAASLQTRADCPDNAYYVAPDGNDANPGSEDAPWATINYAITTTGAGDCVLVRAGDYEEGGEIWVREGQGGSADARWSLEAYPGETPVLHTRLILQGDHIRARGLTMASGAPIISWYPATDLEILENHFDGAYTYAAIQIAGSDILVEGNVIALANEGNTQDHGIYVLHGSGKTVRNNLISNTPGYGIHVYDEDKYDWPGDIADVLIEGNIIRDNLNRSAVIVATSGVSVQDVTIRRNVVDGCAGGVVLRSGAVAGVDILHNTMLDVGFGVSLEEGAGPSDVTVHNNVFWGLAGDGVTVSAGAPTVQSNTWGPGRPATPDTAPSFADPLVGADYRLTDGSPAIDAGIDLGEAFEGAAPDHGACEFGVDACPGVDGPVGGSDGGDSGGSDGGGTTSGGGPATDDGGPGGSDGGGDVGTQGSSGDASAGSSAADASAGGDSSGAPSEDADGGGCGCTQSRAPGHAWWLAVVLVALRRRRAALRLRVLGAATLSACAVEPGGGATTWSGDDHGGSDTGTASADASSGAAQGSDADTGASSSDDGSDGGGSSDGGDDSGGQGVAPGAPAILFVDVDAGPNVGGPDDLGAPIALFGKGFGSERGDATVTIGGVEVASYRVWGAGNANNATLDKIVVQPGAAVTGGAIVVHTDAGDSNDDHSFAVNQASVYYVAADGSDGGDCSEAAPCATILHAVTARMVPGDTVLVRGGDHPESEVWIRGDMGHSGAAGANKVIRAYPGEEVRLTNGDRPFIVDADYITISGFRFEAGKSIGLGNESSVGNRAYDNSFAGEVAWDAIGTHGDDVVVAGNWCDLTGGSVGTQSHCYYVSHGTGIALLHNYAAGAPGYGIHIYDQKRADPDIQRVIADVLVEGNLLTGSPERSGMIIAIDDEGGYGNRIEGVTIRNNVFFGNNHAGMVVGGSAPVEGIEIHHNTFWHNGREGFYIGGEAVADVDVRNNLFFQDANDVCLANCSWFELAHWWVEHGTDIVVEGNFYDGMAPTMLGAQDAGVVSGNAAMVDPAALDFTLAQGSAAIDAAAALQAVAHDRFGVARPQGEGPDFGAHEANP